jgi:hypothetical protein
MDFSSWAIYSMDQIWIYLNDFKSVSQDVFLTSEQDQSLFSLLEHIINLSQTDVSDKFPPNRFDIVYISMGDEVRTNIKQVFVITYKLFPILLFSILIVQTNCCTVIT